MSGPTSDNTFYLVPTQENTLIFQTEIPSKPPYINLSTNAKIFSHKNIYFHLDKSEIYMQITNYLQWSWTYIFVYELIPAANYVPATITKSQPIANVPATDITVRFGSINEFPTLYFMNEATEQSANATFASILLAFKNTANGETYYWDPRMECNATTGLTWTLGKSRDCR